MTSYAHPLWRLQHAKQQATLAEGVKGRKGTLGGMQPSPTALRVETVAADGWWVEEGEALPALQAVTGAVGADWARWGRSGGGGITNGVAGRVRWVAEMGSGGEGGEGTEDGVGEEGGMAEGRGGQGEDVGRDAGREGLGCPAIVLLSALSIDSSWAWAPGLHTLVLDIRCRPLSPQLCLSICGVSTGG